MFNARLYILLVLIVGTSITSAKDYVLPEGVSVLTDKELLTLFVGNTAFNRRFFDYYEPPAEGEMQGKLGSKHMVHGPYGGTWSIDGPLICWEFDRLPLSAFGSCVTVAKDGDTFPFFKTNGAEYYLKGGRIKVVSGNPENL